MCPTDPAFWAGERIRPRWATKVLLIETTTGTSRHPASSFRKSGALLCVIVANDPNVGDHGPRWEYVILWRYGALLLVVVGLLMIGFGASGLCGTAIGESLLPIGFVSLVAGVVLPRIEGRFSAGPTGLSAEMLAVHRLDRTRYVVSGPAFAPEVSDQADAGDADAALVGPTIGDVWDAIDAAGLRADGAGMGHAYFRLRGDRHLDMPNRGFLDWGTASDDLLAVIKTWGIEPVASGLYPVPQEIEASYARRHAGSLRDIPTRRDDGNAT